MPVVQIGIMWMLVSQRLVLVPVRVGFIDSSRVIMLVMLVVNMLVLMGYRFMNVLVFVPLGEMEPKAQSHQ